MAHYAFINENNRVTYVIVGKDENVDGIDWEQHYSEVMGMKCKRCSYNTVGGTHRNDGTPFRKNYPGEGYIYDEERDAFYPEKPFPSWTLNEDTCLWDAPTPRPEDDKKYRWSEDNLNWEEIIIA
jgi:hypothetical protein